MKACFPSVLERQDVKLVLKVVNELTVSALKIIDESRLPEYRKNTSDFVYSGVRVIASRILHEIFWLIGELAIRRTSLYDEHIFQN